MMDNLKIFELLDNDWVEKDTLDFDLVIVGDKPISKSFCFSPTKYDIIDLKAKIEDPKEFNFVDSKGHLSSTWKSINPQKIKVDDKSNPVKIEFNVDKGPIRLDSFKILVEYLEVP